MAGSGYSQDVVAVNVFDASKLESRTRTSPAGSTAVRYTVTIEAEPVLHDFSAEALGKGPATAIRDLLSRLTKEISARASPATIAKRANAAASLARGDASTVARYSGGRTGLKAPGAASPDRLFNDSGRLADGLAVMRNPEEDAWTINVPANRLDPRTFSGGEGAMARMFARLVELVPEWGGGQALLQHASIREAIETATVDAIYVQTKRATERLKNARWQLLSAIGRDLAKIVTLG